MVAAGFRRPEEAGLWMYTVPGSLEGSAVEGKEVEKPKADDFN